jgi:hypothetical protein
VSKITVPRFIGCVALVAGFFFMPVHAASLEVTLVDHVITYTDESGHRKRIDVGKPCDDLWIAPDGSAFAFIGIDKYIDFPDPPSHDAIATTVYIARRSDHFRPKPIADTVQPGPYHFPSISSDGAYVFFVGLPGGAGFLFAHNLRTGKTEGLDAAHTRSLIGYCTIWSGKRAGGVLFEDMFWKAGVGYGGDGCYLKTSGKPTMPASCAPLEHNLQLRGEACPQTTP